MKIYSYIYLTILSILLYYITLIIYTVLVVESAIVAKKIFGRNSLKLVYICNYLHISNLEVS